MARIFITGSADGLGRAAALSLMDGGHDVVVHARSQDRAGAVAGLVARGAAFVVGDLASRAGVMGVAQQVNALGRMDAVIHNAGIYTTRGRDPTPESHARIFAVNTLAPFMLTALLQRPERLVYLSSGLHRGGEGSLRDLDWTSRRWDTGTAYAESKLHMVALAALLARRWPGVVSSAVDPGWVRTRMGGASAPVDIATGTRTQAWLAVSNEPAAQVSGHYWHHMAQETPAREAGEIAFQDALVGKLAELTGVSLP
jgi:NAD(P)-dependent dehydrogenase (short-subunit alcohol dehydrogenase family)